MTFPNSADMLAIAPQLLLSFFAIVILLTDAIVPRVSRKLLANVAILGLVVAGVVTAITWPKENSAKPMMQGMVIADGYTGFFTLVLLLGAAISVWLSVKYLEERKSHRGEYLALMLFTTLGAIIMAASVNLICVFIGLEILSISLYILAGFETERRQSDEAALKYFLLGAFASGFLLYGIALIYGASGTLSIPAITDGLRDASGGIDAGKHMLLLCGVGLMLVGFGFKVAAVPFHVWAPDVYQGAPTTITAFMSVIAKTAGFAAFLRAFVSGFSDQSLQLQISMVLASVAALTMLVGNVVAIVQPNLKRMLAYSSIAHAGYMLLGLVAAMRPSTGFGTTSDPRADAVTAVLFYSLVYTVSNLGAFAVLIALRKRGQEVTEIADLAGLSQRSPGLAALMALFVLSLAGLPPTAGFFGKLFLFQALIGMSSPLPWLVILFALTSVVSFYYYLGVVKAMYMDAPAEDVRDQPSGEPDLYLRLSLGLCTLGVIVFGLWSSPAMGLAKQVADQFFTNPGAFSAMR